MLVKQHMDVARLELIALSKHCSNVDKIDLEMTSAASSLLQLWGQVPKRPLQWTALRNSCTSDASFAGNAACVTTLQAIGLQLGSVKGSYRLTWPLPADPANCVRSLPLGACGEEGLHAAVELGIVSHPGLLTRWRVGGRDVALCPSCSRYRRLCHADHSTWVPDEIDRHLCVLPPRLAAAQAEEMGRLTARTSARDHEEFDRDAFVEMVSALSVSTAIKCSCEGGGDLYGHIGVPPSRTQRPMRPLMDGEMGHPAPPDHRGHRAAAPSAMDLDGLSITEAAALDAL